VSRTSVVGVVGALIMLVTIVRLILRGRMRVQYAALWLVVGCGIGLMALIPGVLDNTAELLGFAVAANLLFFGGLVVLVLVGIHLSVAITRTEDHVQRLAEEIAILNEKLKDR
jgi:hypothetical protein